MVKARPQLPVRLGTVRSRALAANGWSISNERTAAEQWSRHWASFVHGEAVEADVHIELNGIWDAHDLTNPMHRPAFDHSDIREYRSRMSGAGPSYARADARCGDPWSPDGGERSERLAGEFLDNPQEAYRSQPDHPRRDALLQEVKAFLLAHPADTTLDVGHDANYTDNFPGFAPSPIFAPARIHQRSRNT